MARATTSIVQKMRPALVQAHNTGNKKPINKDFIDGNGVDNTVFIEWKNVVKKLQETVGDYVAKRSQHRNGATDVTEADLYAARERIYPKWKDTLKSGEKDAITKELRLNEYDVEDLIGFSWGFMSTARGTVVCNVKDDTFRQKVESLIGIIIAKNDMLTNSERDMLDAYYKAQNSVQRCIDRKAEADKKIKDWELLEKGTPSDDFKIYIKNQINLVKDELKAIAESKAKAEADIKKYAGDARLIESKLALIK